MRMERIDLTIGNDMAGKIAGWDKIDWNKLVDIHGPYLEDIVDAVYDEYEKELSSEAVLRILKDKGFKVRVQYMIFDSD